jgi:transposase-like protein
VATGGTRHEQGIKEEARAQEREPVSLSELIHLHVRAAIERAVHGEMRAALGTSPYERRDVRRGYRNGMRERTLTGPAGPVVLPLPRATLFRGAGDVNRCRESSRAISGGARKLTKR